jgi:RHS repeat-associated protein
VQVIRPNGSMLKTTYDNDGNVIEQIDGLGNKITYQYNGLNQRIRMTDPLLRSVQYGYDGVGKLLTVQNPKDAGVSYTMGYDPINELKSVTYSDGGTPNVSYQYDADGQRTQMTDGTGTTTYAFDSLHRLTSNQNGASAQVQYGYDLLGHVTQIIYPGGRGAVNRTYDAAGRLVAVSDWLNNTTRFAYDPNGNLTAQRYPNGVVASLDYDAADRIKQSVEVSNGSQLLSLGYTQDMSSQLTAENSTTYGYDPNNRLITATIGSSRTAYGYDAGDNLATINGTNSTTQSYDAANEVATATTMNGPTLVQRFTYAYDANGNRTSRTDRNNVVTNFGWDQANRLTSTGPAVTYSYNGDGLRMSKTVSGAAEPFVWDVADGLPLVIQDGAVSYVSGAGGQVLERISGGTIFFYHHDQLGSTRAITDASGTSVAAYSYGPYGDVVSSTGSLSNPFQFAGQYTDTESGLQSIRARYYDGATGQFLSRDPIVQLTVVPYGYAHDNPVNESDPTGLCGINPFAKDSCLGNAAGVVAGVAKTVVHIGLDLLAVPPYVMYDASYHVMKWINDFGDQHGVLGTVVSRVISVFFLPTEALGLGGDIAIDWVKGHTVANEPVCDEGQKRFLNPLHDYVPDWAKGPQVWLDGLT